MKKLILFLVLFSLILSLSGCSTISKSSTNIYKGINNYKYSSPDNTCIDWFFIPNNEFRTPDINDKLKFSLSDYDAIYNGPTSKDAKTLYLTFDEGYENGYTPQILDVLKEKNVKAIFFVTSHYIKYSPDTINRMANEGHVVGNHTNTHPSMPSVAYSSDTFNKELFDVENKYKELTGKELSKFFRPPMGKYSQKSLSMTKDLGYKTVFWSFAYGDYEPTNQPNPAQAKQNILNHLHDGSILLLHAISKTNATILGDVIDEARALGYEFKLIP